MPNQTLCYPCLTRSTHTLVTLHDSRYRCPVCGARGVVETVSLLDYIGQPVRTLSEALWVRGQAHYAELN